ncbi:MAG: hypothetical protein H6851_02755 [Geminicoccaceae bacterium]|nr:hypothetical protein [Geminicoccaceae bacterium]
MNFVVGAAAVWAAAAGGLYLLQDRLIFPRDATPAPVHPLPDGTRKLELRTTDGHAIHGYLHRRPSRNRDLLLVFSGNAWNAADCFTFTTQRLNDIDIAAFHYRGYHPSEGKPGQQALFDDALLIYDTLVKSLQPARVYTIGFSLGSGVAAWLASRRPVAGQILVTPFDSIEEIARRRYRVIPVSMLLRHPFRSIEHLRSVDIPTAVIAAGDDRVVPPERTRRLMTALRNIVMYETISDASHSGIYDMEIIDRLLANALAAISGRPLGNFAKP